MKIMRKLGIFSFFLLLIGLVTVLALVQQRQELRKKAASYTAVLRLSPSENQVSAVGNTFPLDIILDPGGQSVVASDIVLFFRQDELQVVNIEPGPSTGFGVFAPVNPSTGSFNVQTVKTQANSQGQLSFGALAFNWATETPTSAITQLVNPLATITFQVIQQPTAAISFCFKSAVNDPCQGQVIQGSTPDTNVVNDQGEDILGTVNQATVEIVGDVSPTPTTTGVPPTPTTTGVPPTATPTPTNTPTLTPTPTATATPIPTLTPTPTNTPFPNPTPTQEPQKGNLTFKVKFQGLTQDTGSKRIKVTLRPSVGQEQVIDSFEVTHEANGVYAGTLYNLDLDTYTVLVKGWAHLQKKFENIVLNAGQNTQDWSATTLLSGDSDNNNAVDILDFTPFVATYGQTGNNLAADFDGNLVVNILDFTPFVENYTKHGDN